MHNANRSMTEHLPHKAYKRQRKRRAMSDINITPMVDVMLVLLIIFMITAPLLTTGVPVNLPKTKAPALQESVEPLVLTINAQGELFIQNKKIALKNLVEVLKAVTNNRKDTRIYLRSDTKLAYGKVIAVIASAAKAGFTRIALITASNTSRR